MTVAKQWPVVIAESAPAKVDVVTDGTLAWNDWFTPYFGLIAAHRGIEWFVYINYAAQGLRQVHVSTSRP